MTPTGKPDTDVGMVRHDQNITKEWKRKERKKYKELKERRWNRDTGDHRNETIKEKNIRIEKDAMDDLKHHSRPSHDSADPMHQLTHTDLYERIPLRLYISYFQI